MIERNVEALKARVIEGNKKLNEAWEKICQIDHESPRWAAEMEKWHKATGKLSTLCTELEAAGFIDCLYIENGKKIKKCLGSGGLGCMACPSQTRYWETEWNDLPSAGGKQRLL